MYNRYIPNANGSFDRQRIPTPPPKEKPAEPEKARHEEAPKPKAPQPKKISPERKGLLPDHLDTGDLLVLLILLLILQDGEEDGLSILLAIGAFFLLQ